MEQEEEGVGKGSGGVSAISYYLKSKWNGETMQTESGRGHKRRGEGGGRRRGGQG